MWKHCISSEVMNRVQSLNLPFNQFGVDPFGVSKKHLALSFTVTQMLYRHYFSVSTHGIEHVPSTGRVMLVCNHSGGIAFDGLLIISALFFDMDPPRLAHGMTEKFLNKTPFISQLAARTGQLSGLPEHATQLLEHDRVLLVFPEGARGTAKLYKDRNSLVRFGSGFVRLAMQTKSPILPVAFLGGGEIFPTVANLYRLGKLIGVPYIPVTRHFLPIPKAVPCQIHFGEPIFFEGDGREGDDVIEEKVQDVKQTIHALMKKGLLMRGEDGHLLQKEELSGRNSH